MRHRPTRCAGCEEPIHGRDYRLTCAFAKSGFVMPSGMEFPPCGVAYHTQCFRVGEPFRCRRRNQVGLVFPRVKHWGTFICERCTVGAFIGRRPHTPSDRCLMALERMRILEMAHYWQQSTHSHYQAYLGTIRRFEDQFNLQILQREVVTFPPTSQEIALMWVETAHSLRPGNVKDGLGMKGQVRADTIRHIRASASQFFGWEAAITRPEVARTVNHQVIFQECRATDRLSFTYFAKGQAARVGSETRPSVPLLFRHILSMDTHFQNQYDRAATVADRRLWARAGLLNLVLWYTWTRSSEALGLRWCDVECIDPDDGGSFDLPPGLGMVAFRLLPETKSNRTAAANVVASHTSRSGLSLGKWYARLAQWMPPSHSPFSQQLIFQHENGLPWCSMYFRQEFLYPFLLQSLPHDPYLQQYDSLHLSVCERFWSLHSYRRGARSHVSRGGVHAGIKFRKASPTEVYEHGRWRLKQGSQPIDLVYNDWPYEARLFITHRCQ